MAELTTLQRQTQREIREGARQSKKHAQALRKEIRLARKKGMTHAEWISWRLDQKEKRQKKGSPPVRRAPTPLPDSDANLPWQHRRDMAIALAKARGEENSRILQLARLQESLLASVDEINNLFKEIC